MKNKITVLFLIFSSFLFSQELKIIQAVQKSDSDYFDYEDYEIPKDGSSKFLVPIGDLQFLKGCSWYCGGSVSSIKASSALKSNGKIEYSANNSHDFDKNTAWVEGVAGYGIGEYIEYSFDFTEDQHKFYKGNLGINEILLANGYKKSKSTWKNNSRVKQLKVYLNDEPYAILNLLDSFEIQTINIGEIMFPANKNTKLRFEITQIYKGDKYKDTAISLLMFDGVGVH